MHSRPAHPPLLHHALLLLLLLLLLAVHAPAPSLPDSDAAPSRLLLKRAAVKQRLRAVSSNAERLAALKDAYAGETCFIVACGPSLANVSSARIRAAVAGGVVFAVKQAAALLGDAADFHLMNVVNLQPMQHDARHPPVIVFHTDARLDHQRHSTAWGHVTADILLRTHPRVAGQKHLQLVHTHDWDSFTFDRTARLPWAPGIVMEIGVYLTVHVGCALVTFIGWDVTSDYSHFWDSRQKTGHTVSPDAFIPLSAGGTYGASARDLLDEFALVRRESRVMHRWLLARSIRAAVASPGAGSTIDPDIPRVSLFDDAYGDALNADASVAHAHAPPSPANFTTAPLFCHTPSSSVPAGAYPPPPCVTVTHPQDGFAFTQWQRGGPLEWRDMRVPEGGAHAVLHVISESEGVAVSVSSSAGDDRDYWVLLHLDGGFLCTAAVGNCSACCAVPIALLAPGSHELLAELADADGNVLVSGSSRFRIIDAH